MRALLRRLRYLLRRSRFDNDLAEEMEFHREMKEQELARHGGSTYDASFAARRSLGNTAVARDQSRDVWVWPSVDEFVHDLRFAVRALYRDRGFTLAALAMLTLAVALNASVFTIMDAMLFRAYPLVKGNERLLYLQERFPSGQCCISYPDFEAWRTQSHAFEAMAFIGERAITFGDSNGRPADMLAFTISPNTFRLLGVQPVLGRDFVASDETPGAAPVAVLNYRFWDSRFGKRADVVGTTVRINGVPTTVIGVMPEGFDFPTRENVWMPLVRTPDLQQRSVIQNMAVAKLRSGTTPREARADLETINRRLEADYPATNRGVVAVLHPYSEVVSGPDAAVIWGSLWVGSWFVLFVACANLANLSLVRTSRRWREFATRMALGAGQARMIRHIALEMLMLAGAAGVLGCWITTWSVGWWAVATASRYQVLNYTVDRGTFGYVLAVTIAAAILGSVPSIARLAQLGEGTALRGDARGVTGAAVGKHLARALVAGQMALAIVLLSGSGVLVRSVLKIIDADTGVRDSEHVLVGAIRLPADEYSTADSRLVYFDRLHSELTAIPGVQVESVGSTLPVGSVNVWPIEIEGRPVSTDRGAPCSS
jgi:predicted permease